MHPALTLLIGTAMAAFLAAFLWPVRGLLWRLVELLRANERVHIEDALKHLHESAYRGAPATLLSLAGALGLSGDRTATLVARLEVLGLVSGKDSTYTLTSRGTTEARQVVRVHRLWERYLSEETGYPATEWHLLADRREHTTGPEEADALARRMGEPRYDPHGDPIPTKSGLIAPPQGRPLTELAVGEAGRVVHVEDEPAAIFAQLVACGLHPGAEVRVTASTKAAIRFETAFGEQVLAPVLASNLTVAPLPEATPETATPVATLAALKPGSKATVKGLSRRFRAPERRRLLDMGIVPGTVVEAELEAPGGDPIAYRVRGAVLALRREQAELIEVDPLETEAAA